MKPTAAKTKAIHVAMKPPNMKSATPSRAIIMAIMTSQVPAAPIEPPLPAAESRLKPPAEPPERHNYEDQRDQGENRYKYCYTHRCKRGA